jgi:hypothetical protein
MTARVAIELCISHALKTLLYFIFCSGPCGIHAMQGVGLLPNNLKSHKYVENRINIALPTFI